MLPTGDSIQIEGHAQTKSEGMKEDVPFCPGEYFLSEVLPASKFSTHSRGKGIRLLNGPDQVSIVA